MKRKLKRRSKQRGMFYVKNPTILIRLYPEDCAEGVSRRTFDLMKKELGLRNDSDAINYAVAMLGKKMFSGFPGGELKRRPTLAEMLEGMIPEMFDDPEVREWLEAPRVGRELI